MVNSSMNPNSYTYYYSDPAEVNKEEGGLIDRIVKGEYVALHGPRASGKTTRVFRAMQQLSEEYSYDCLYMTMQQIDLQNTQSFWTSVHWGLHSMNPDLYGQNRLVINTRATFNAAFISTAWAKRIVMFIDEFDVLYAADATIRKEFLDAIRSMKNKPNECAVKSMVAVGTFGILHLPSDHDYTSPFNVQNPLQNANLSEQRVQKLFEEYELDRDLIIEPSVLEDICQRTNGQASLVCICGKAIDSKLLKLCKGKLTLGTWVTFAVKELYDDILAYATFRSLIWSLEKVEAKPAVTLLRSRFLHNQDEEHITDPTQERLAWFLARLGVLRAGQQSGYFVMSSPLLSSVIQRRVIPMFFPAFPSKQLPKLPDGRINILEALEIAIRTFDKGTFASGYSYKIAPVVVGKIRREHVPRESVYQQELTSTIGNWLRQCGSYTVDTQSCVQTVKKDGQATQLYSDIMIMSPDMPTTIIELVATETWQVVHEHYERTLLYGTSQPHLNIGELWTIHFTREDDYLDNPYWPTEKQMKNGLGAVVFWHNLGFTQVFMSALWMEAGVEQNITKRQILPVPT